ncbi:hypothetical protein HN51_012578 [Arachis hypogaea]|uniref:RING-type domain-containing protein n=1 Tax=Arachis hypogaea TaxID=3818 RepID=A0A445DTW4_ARAHY|nr:probable E3 ubiquitin-protein ligase RHA1A [Arachis hypogaea]XP_057752079.1 brassinosteroid-responsive RING protein 1-like [Arachis stenosperma]QHO58077.1 RING-H2 zinc finger proteina [Arachis hypogaea]RYR66620.1 hypothetical protein Ahy_A03g012651 [Arachis hypogaea]
MGFPVGYTELLFPKPVLQILSVLGYIRRLIFTFFSYTGLPNFLEPDDTDNTMPQFHPVSELLIGEILPVVKFSELVEPPERCAVCLTDFEQEDEIRRLVNCTHVFHRGCVDRWMGYDQSTCPLCRTPFIPDDFFNHGLWAASAIPEFHA